MTTKINQSPSLTASAEPESARTPSPAEAEWEKKVLDPTLKKSPARAKEFTTISDYPIRRLYTPADLKGWSPEKDLGFPGQPPYTRGIHSTMYRGRRWTMRQFAGFGAAEDTNRRFRYLLAQGQTGLSVAFDLPTLMGYDSDHALSEGEVGKCGVAISSLADMEVLFDQIPLAQITTSMTINSPAAVIWAMYLAVAEKQGADWQSLGGTLQNDILKEYIAQKEYIYPPEPSLRLVIDTFEFGACHVPKFNPISISGYHIREAGSTAIQELAFTLRDGIEYVDWAIRRGLEVDNFAPRLSFFFNAHNDFFEEIAKYRAARRIWYKTMRERFGAKNARSWALRFHTQTAGCSLTAQQPYNNVVRTAIQALAAVLGGTQSLHTNSLDEAWALPTEFAATVALRTQQIIAHETGVTNTVDPLGGSYFVEALTGEVERGAWDGASTKVTTSNRTHATTQASATPPPRPLLSRSAPAAATTGKMSGHASVSGWGRARHGISTCGGQVHDDASSPAQTISRPTSTGPALSGAATPKSSPVRSTTRPDPSSTTSEAHGT